MRKTSLFALRDQVYMNLQHLLRCFPNVDLSALSSASLIPAFPFIKPQLSVMSWSSWSSQWPAYSQSSNEKAQWSADSQSSSDTWAHNKWSTPEKQQNTWGDQQWDYASPTGVPYVEGLPDSFKPDKKHLDSKEVYGKTMLRKVAPTSWASKYRLAGRDISDIRLTDLLWRGWNNHHLRALSHGQYVSLVIARRVNESVLSSQLLTAIREQKWDLDELSNEFFRLHLDKVTLKATMNADETKAAKTQAVANYIVECLQPFSTASSAGSSSDQTQLIADLQAQLEAEKAKNKAPSPPAMSQPPAKRIRLCGKTATVGGLSKLPLHPILRKSLWIWLWIPRISLWPGFSSSTLLREWPRPTFRSGLRTSKPKWVPK